MTGSGLGDFEHIGGYNAHHDGGGTVSQPIESCDVEVRCTGDGMEVTVSGRLGPVRAATEVRASHYRATRFRVDAFYPYAMMVLTRCRLRERVRKLAAS